MRTMDRSAPRRRVARIAARAALLLVVAPAGAGAQASFAWPAAGADYSRYSAPEQCIVALRRVIDSTQWGEPDTTRFDPAAPLPDVAGATVRRCGARFPLGSATTDRDGALVELYLAMGRTDDAKALVARRLAAAAAKGSRSGEEAHVLMTSINAYLDARPAAVDQALALAARLDRLGSAARRERVGAHAAMYEFARSVMDTGLMRQEAVALTTAADGLTDEEWMTPGVQSAIADAILSMTLPLLRDSTEDAFLAVLHQRMRKTLGDSYGSKGAGSIGRPVPRLAGDWWFGVADTATPRPRAGRLTFVMSVDWRCGGDCYPAYAVLRRLHARYGDALDVVLVAQTDGYFRLRPPLAPAEEAEALHQYFLGELALPGALTVSSTPFTFRPDPDLRRVDKPTQNDTTYVLESGSHGNTIVVVDPRGTVVYYTQGLQPRKEREITAVLDFLTARQRAR